RLLDRQDGGLHEQLADRLESQASRHEVEPTRLPRSACQVLHVPHVLTLTAAGVGPSPILCETPPVAEADQEEERKPTAYGPVAHLVFVVLAAVAVYSFVSVSKEGEMRRRCTPTCLLRPTYAGYEKRAPNFTLKDTLGHDVSLESYRG